MDIKAYKDERENKRLANALIFFAKNTENCGAVKANKLLYYLDCHHLIKYGRKVLKDTYNKDAEGPVPHKAYHAVHALVDAQEYDNSENFMSEYIAIKVEKLKYEENEKEYILHRLVPKKEFEGKWFSQSEREIMNEVAKKYFSTTATQLSRQTHLEAPWKSAVNNGDEIDIKLFAIDKVTPEQYKEIESMERDLQALENNCTCH
ncbi:MAG: DUF4065 domain-containing protein [Spirochaetes bacterium]|nr:MAG: DUF4065 domain-containing protein [Spirochaetota bacterium]